MSKLYDPNSFRSESVPPTPRSIARSVAPQEEDEDQSPQPSQEELEMFKQQVQQWAKLDDQIKKLAVAVRERRVQQKALGTRIQEFMIKFNYDNLNTNTGRIRSSVRQVKQPLKLSDIREKVTEMSGADVAAKIFDDDNRPLVERRSLRRIVPKVSMSLDI